MGRYDALLGYLDASERDSETMSLDEIGALLESPLPASARKYPAFWSSANHIGRLLRSRGWDAKPRLSAREVVFVREQRGSSALSTGSDPDESSDLVLVGCVKGKHSGRHAAKDLYSSALFGGRRAEAEALGAPWFILTAAGIEITFDRKLAENLYQADYCPPGKDYCVPQRGATLHVGGVPLRLADAERVVHADGSVSFRWPNAGVDLAVGQRASVHLTQPEVVDYRPPPPPSRPTGHSSSGRQTITGRDDL